MTTLVVVAQRAKGRLFIQEGGSNGDLREVRDLTHPESRLKGGAVDTDRPGRVHDRTGTARHSMEKQESPKERAAADFAREVSSAITDLRNENQFNRLVLVAEPGFMGLLRDALDKPSAKMVEATVNKELTDLGPDKIKDHVREALKNPAL